MEVTLLLLLLLPLASGQGCPFGAVPNSVFSRCFHLMITKADFVVADQTCRLIGGNLTSILNADDNAIIDVMMQNRRKLDETFETAWIGGNNLLSYGDWKWTDGEPFNYSSRGSGGPKVLGFNCLSYGEMGAWIQSDCSEKKAFICATAFPEPCPPPTCTTPDCPIVSCPTCTTAAPTTEPSTTVPPTAVPTTTPSSCPTPPYCAPGESCSIGCYTGWTLNRETRFCYMAAVNNEAKWAEAEAYCLEQDSHLASIHDPKENAFVESLAFAGNTNTEAWLGGHYYDEDKQFHWTDGCPFDYANWAPNEPIRPDVDNCLEMSLWNGLWNDISCELKTRVIVCKKPAFSIL
ncbi:hypothetical protein QR680_008337 [Steinernema hermaphroditum]|uniref:C-type lectin domain-containing protein n=1 Tax=Steinernema hermaphroditum TaxID=289476 RepID=A0AA39M7X4_9BILA|nr:hypothetical protein QR680_008337 [Steinernema hermaphroditum]